MSEHTDWMIRQRRLVSGKTDGLLLQSEARMSEIELPEPAYHYVAETRRAYSNKVVEAFAGSSPLYTAEQVRQILAAERERCAQIAESTIVAEYEGVDCYGDKAAEAIRRG